VSHGHGHGEPNEADESSHGSSRKRLGLVLMLTAGFMGVEIAVGFWSGSLALLADAGHMFADSGALALALLVSVIAERPPDDERTYGYRRAEVLGALANATGLLLIVAMIVNEAIGRLSAPPELRAAGLIGTALAGLVVNVVAVAILFRGARGDLNVKAALYHVIGDALGSVSAVVAGVLVLAFGLTIADPIASLVIAALILFGALRLLRETAHVLMEGAPSGIDVDHVRRTIAETEGVAEVHDLHVWCLSPAHPMLSAHVTLSPGHHGVEVSHRVGERLHTEHGLEHVTIQPEAPGPTSELVELRAPSE
jgi:cobalt-zinc-cadmium efflux system protein